MYKEKVFVSFDYENDKHYKFLLSTWNSNPSFEFTFDDCSAREIKSDSVSVVKNVLSRKINEARTVIVLVGKEADKTHPNYREIGYRNWQNYEVAKAKELGKKLIAVQINSQYAYPEELLNSNAIKVCEFSQNAITKAIRGY